MNQATHENDFYTWTEEQADVIRTRQFNLEKNFDDIDWQNLIEDLDFLGGRERRELESRLKTLFEDILIPILKTYVN